MKDANHREEVSGIHYINYLSEIHTQFQPETYFEIGVQAGKSLQMANCATIAVDPNFICEINIIGTKPVCHLYQQTSDNFFDSQDPSKIFGKSIDMAFLDGMHWFEFLLRDFINTEKYCSDKSIIIMHDCLPPGFYMTSRDIKDAFHPLSDFQGWWAGDVWKIVPTLQKYRPDLSIVVTDCVPTGLVIVSSLDPENNVLLSNYKRIVEEFKEMSRDEYDKYWNEIEVVPSINIMWNNGILNIKKFNSDEFNESLNFSADVSP